MKARFILLFLSCLILLSSCGTTQLLVLEPNTDIYIDGNKRGTGKVTIQRMGPPHRIHVTAVRNGETVGAIDVRRKIDAVTVLFGLCTYYTGFLFAWRYPDLVMIPSTPVNNNSYDKQKRVSQWDLPPGSSWDKK